MDIQNLRTFITLAQVKNFTQTAEHLFVAQSTITNRISELEKELGKKLFERNRRQIELTNEGSLFLLYAKRIVELEEVAFQKVNTISKYPNTLRIGTTNTIYETYLSKELPDYKRNHSDTAIKIILGHSTELLQQLQDGVIDMAYTYIPLYKNGYQCELYHEDQLILVTDYQNTLFENGIKKSELIGIDYLMCDFKLQGVGEFIRELFPPYYQFPFEIDNSTKLIPYLIHGTGYSFLPNKLVEDYVSEKKLRKVALLDFESPFINSYCIKNKTAVVQ
jgi:Transcriptional regulator